MERGCVVCSAPGKPLADRILSKPSVKQTESFRNTDKFFFGEPRTSPYKDGPGATKVLPPWQLLYSLLQTIYQVLPTRNPGTQLWSSTIAIKTPLRIGTIHKRKFNADYCNLRGFSWQAGSAAECSADSESESLWRNARSVPIGLRRNPPRIPLREPRNGEDSVDEATIVDVQHQAEGDEGGEHG